MATPSNRSMVTLVKQLGFTINVQMEEGVVNMALLCGAKSE